MAVLNSERSELSVRHGPMFKVTSGNPAASLQVEKEEEGRDGGGGRGGAWEGWEGEQGKPGLLKFQGKRSIKAILSSLFKLQV